MNKYNYKIGLIAGRFQPFHLGHLHMVLETLKQCETVVILLGSSNNINNEYNPLTYAERKGFIRKALQAEGIKDSRVKFAPIVDIYVGNHPTFGHYIMNMCKFVAGKYPNLLVSGTEPDRDKWIDKEKYPELKYFNVPRSDIQVSATQIRTSMRAGDTAWYNMVPTCLIKPYNDILKERIT